MDFKQSSQRPRPKSVHVSSGNSGISEIPDDVKLYGQDLAVPESLSTVGMVTTLARTNRSLVKSTQKSFIVDYPEELDGIQAKFENEQIQRDLAFRRKAKSRDDPHRVHDAARLTSYINRMIASDPMGNLPYILQTLSKFSHKMRPLSDGIEAGVQNEMHRYALVSGIGNVKMVMELYQANNMIQSHFNSKREQGHLNKPKILLSPPKEDRAIAKAFGISRLSSMYVEVRSSETLEGAISKVAGNFLYSVFGNSSGVSYDVSAVSGTGASKNAGVRSIDGFFIPAKQGIGDGDSLRIDAWQHSIEIGVKDLSDVLPTTCYGDNGSAVAGTGVLLAIQMGNATPLDFVLERSNGHSIHQKHEKSSERISGRPYNQFNGSGAAPMPIIQKAGTAAIVSDPSQAPPSRKGLFMSAVVGYTRDTVLSR